MPLSERQPSKIDLPKGKRGEKILALRLMYQAAREQSPIPKFKDENWLITTYSLFILDELALKGSTNDVSSSTEYIEQNAESGEEFRADLFMRSFKRIENFAYVGRSSWKEDEEITVLKLPDLPMDTTVQIPPSLDSYPQI